MKASILKYKNRKILAQESSRNQGSYQDAKDIAILFSADKEEKLESALFLKKMLEADRKEVNIYLYTGKQIKEHPDSRAADFQRFSNQSFGILGNVIDDGLREFCERPFDYLFHLDIEPSIFSRYVLASSKAQCRMGIHNKNMEPYYDFMIKHKADDDLKRITEQLLEYAKMLT
jgi:hypothetical protein